MDTKQLYHEIESGKYDNRARFPTRKEDGDNFVIAMRTYREEGQLQREAFKRDALRAVGLSNHPKADKIFEHAWERGHASGIHEVLTQLISIAELFTD